MRFAEHMTPWVEGTNGVLEFMFEGRQRYYSLVDDLSMIKFQVDLQSKKSIVECKAQDDDLVQLTFSGLENITFESVDTFHAYNTHDPSVDLEIIDQSIYDPEGKESKQPVTIVGLGWIIRLWAADVNPSVKGPNIPSAS
jgi:hypothetical protein